MSTTGTAISHLSALRIGAPVYWTAIAVWIGLGMAAFAVLWKAPALEALATALAMVAGCMVALLALDIRYDPNNVVVVFHPLEQMFTWAAGSTPQLAEGGSFVNSDRLKFLFEAVAGVVARRTFVQSSSPRPAIFLEWFVIAATVIAIRRREWPLVLQVAALMLTVWGIDSLGMARGLKQEYFILTDPLVIIAAALLVAKLTDLQRHRWTYPIGATLIVAHILVSQAEPVKHIFWTDGPEVLCGLQSYVKRLQPMPSCKPQ